MQCNGTWGKKLYHPSTCLPSQLSFLPLRDPICHTPSSHNVCVCVSGTRPPAEKTTIPHPAGSLSLSPSSARDRQTDTWDWEGWPLRRVSHAVQPGNADTRCPAYWTFWEPLSRPAGLETTRRSGQVSAPAHRTCRLLRGNETRSSVRWHPQLRCSSGVFSRLSGLELAVLIESLDLEVVEVCASASGRLLVRAGTFAPEVFRPSDGVVQCHIWTVLVGRPSRSACKRCRELSRSSPDGMVACKFGGLPSRV